MIFYPHKLIELKREKKEIWKITTKFEYIFWTSYRIQFDESIHRFNNYSYSRYSLRIYVENRI